MSGLDTMEDDLSGDVFLQEGLCPSIAEHATQCNSLFQRKISIADIVPDPTIIDDELARFRLWSNNMDVYGPLNVSLDYRLRYSPTVVQILHQLLDVICDTLDSLHPVDEQPPSSKQRRKKQRVGDDKHSQVAKKTDDYNSSDSDSELDQAEENISKITITIHGTVTRLFRLSNAVRKSANVNRACKIERYIHDEEANTAIAELRLYTDCYIRFRFPEAPDSLRESLIKANELRLRRLYYQRSHRRRIDLSIQNAQLTQAVRPQLPKMKEAPRQAVSFAVGVFQKQPASVNKLSGIAEFVSAPATNATTARQTAVGALYAKSTTDFPRAKSIVVNNKLSFPPVPSSSECPYCGVILEFKAGQRSTLWQNHVIGDLEPFICIFPHCLEGNHKTAAPPTFETSGAWISHMQSAHGHAWECRAPSHPPITFDEEIQYQDHSIREHGVPETHTRLLSSAARRPILDKMLQCPFNDDFQPPEKVQPSPVFASEALQSHIAGHIKEIALLTLQKLPFNTDEDNLSIDSDQPLDDEVGPVLVKFRESMYSVLDDDEDLVFQDDDDAEVANVDLDLEAEGLNPSVTRLDLEDKNEAGMTKLHHAVQNGDLQLAESLMQDGAKLSSRDKGGRTTFHYAFMEQSCYPALINLLLNAGDKSIMNLGDDNGQTVLHYAAQMGNTDGIQILTDNSVDADPIDNYGFTPLLWAVVAGKAGATEKLLCLGAGDPNSASPDGKTALAWAAGLSYVTIARLLVDRGANVSRILKGQMMTPLDEAAAAGNHVIVQLLLGMGANPNSRDRDGWSAIHWAAEEGHLEVVRLLLDAGANVNAVSLYGTSALHCAANGGHVLIVKLLLSRHVDALKANCHGWTALHHAAYMGHSQIARCLLEDEGVRMNASQQDNHGWSVLHLAVYNRDLATIEVLLGSAAIEEPRGLFDESGLTPEEWLDLRPSSHTYKAICNLAFGKSRCCRAVTGLRRAVTIKQAATTGNIPMINLFLSLGHDVNGMNSGRRTALYYAAKQRMLPVMVLLLEHDADPNILPAGRKAWSEFISDDSVLQLLKQAGYRNRDPDPEVARQIRFALGSQDRQLHGPGPNRSVSFAKEDSTLSPRSEQSSFLTSQDMSNLSSSALSSKWSSFPHSSASSIPTQAMAAPSQQTNNQNKRKAGSLARSGGLSKFWKQLTRNS